MIVSDNNPVGKTPLHIDPLGFGCAPLGNLYHPIDENEAKAVLQTAWDARFRYFDTAPHYGQGLSERRVGDLLREMQGKDYVLSTKVGRLLKPAGYAKERHCYQSPMPFDIHYDYSYDGVMRSFEDSIQRLGLDRIDILYMHDIGTVTHGSDNDKYFKDAMSGGYKAMDELRRQGLVSAIGLGVNEYQVCEEAMEYGQWDVFLLAGRYTLLEQESLRSFLPKCEAQGCSVVVGGAYNSGILATGTRTGGTLYYDYGPAPEAVVAKVKRIEQLCDQFHIPLAAAALQFPLAHPAVVSVIPGMGNARRVQQTLDLFATSIPSAFWSALQDSGLLQEGTPIPAEASG